jgi:DNA-directed RNA polymerase subunit K/omega
MLNNSFTSKIITNKQIKHEIVVPKDERITIDFLTKYEFTEIISIRAKDIENDSIIFTNVDEEVDPIKMAKKEFWDKKCPLSIKRYLNKNVVEIWDVNELNFMEK